MGRSYAGILGPLAFGTVVARGLIHGAEAGPTIGWACGCLFAFAAVGYLLGHLAESTVRESVTRRFIERLQAEQKTETEG